MKIYAEVSSTLFSETYSSVNVHWIAALIAMATLPEMNWSVQMQKIQPSSAVNGIQNNAEPYAAKRI